MTAGARVWVTRAEPGAGETAARLRTLGWNPVVKPVLKVEPLDAAVALDGVAALAFTSRNGVAAFVGRSDERALPVFTVGAATAEAAREAGFAEVRAAGGDLEALAALLDAEAPGPVLAIRPEEPAGDLASLARSTAVRSLALYRTVPTGAEPPAFDHLLIHSARAARAVAERLTPEAANRARLIALSAQAARPLEALPFAEARLAATPNEAALLAALGNPPPLR